MSTAGKVIGSVALVGGLVTGGYFLYKYLTEEKEEPEPGEGLLKVDTSPVKGEIFLDGVSQGIAPISVSLLPGNYVVEFGAVVGYVLPTNDGATVQVEEDKTVTITGTYTEEVVPEVEPDITSVNFIAV